MKKNMELFIENEIKFANSQKIRYDGIDDVHAFFSELSAVAIKNNKLYVANKNLFENEIVAELNNLKNFSDDDYQNYFEFAQKLFNFTSNVDIGAAYIVYNALVEYARMKNDVDKLICNLYWKAICLFYMQSKIFLEDIVACFKEASSYKASYFLIESKVTRMYIHRCLANYYMSILMYRHVDKLDLEESFEVGDEVLKFWSDKKIYDLDPDFDFETFKNNYYLNTTALIDYLRKKELKFEALNQELINRIKFCMEQLNLSYQKYGVEKLRVTETRLKYNQLFTQYYDRQMSIDEVLECLYILIKKYPENEYTADGIYSNLHLSGVVMLYLHKSSIPEDRKGLIAGTLLKRTLNYMKNIPVKEPLDTIVNTLNNFILGLGQYKSDEKQINEYADNIINLSVKRHLSLYVHSKMVGKIAIVIAEYFFEQDPFVFVGAYGYPDLKSVLKNKEKLINQVEICGLSFDIGKLSFVNTIFTHTREMSEQDNEIIMNHSKIGQSYFLFNKELQILADCAIGHHKWFNGMGGYPDSFNNLMSPNKFFIDLINIADTIDAATDKIGRSYKDSLTLDEIIENINSNAGTKYSPEIAKVLKNISVYEKLKNIISNDRRYIYYEGYKLSLNNSK